MTAPATTSAARTSAPPIRAFAPRVRRGVLTAHIVSSVGLLGSSSAILALGISGATTHDADLAHAAFQFAERFGFVFGIPLSFTALISGVALGLRTKWGVVRHHWVAAKLGLLVLTIASGALVIGPATTRLVEDSSASVAPLIAGAAFNVAALLTSTGLSVFKPGGRLRRVPG